MNPTTEFSTAQEGTLRLKLIADSGYRCDAEYRISPAQWAEINRVLNEPQK